MAKFKPGDKVRRKFDDRYPSESVVVAYMRGTLMKVNNHHDLADDRYYDLIEASPTNEELRKLVVEWKAVIDKRKRDLWLEYPASALYDAAVLIEEQDRPKDKVREVVEGWVDRHSVSGSAVDDLVESLKKVS